MWSRKNIFEIPPCTSHFLLNEFPSWKGGVLIKSTNSVIKMTWCANGGISKKKSCGISTFKPQISSIFHFDQVGDSQMAYVLCVKKCPSPDKNS